MPSLTSEMLVVCTVNINKNQLNTANSTQKAATATTSHNFNLSRQFSPLCIYKIHSSIARAFRMLFVVYATLHIGDI